MATITTKYSVGDIVYFASVTTVQKQHACPDCNGTKHWKATSPAGGEYDFACPRCTASYRSDADLSLSYAEFAAHTRRLTIGSVRFDSHGGRTEYMCVETGVGGGSIYSEDRLFPTEEAAMEAATLLAATSNKTVEWVAKQYNKTLQLSDYQLDNAKIKLAKDADSRARSMLWNLNDLFSKIEEAEDKETIFEAVADYKRWDWEHDKKAAIADALNEMGKPVEANSIAA